MTIKQQGGIFGRNPTFNDLTVEGTLTQEGSIETTGPTTLNGGLTVQGNSGASALNKITIKDTDTTVAAGQLAGRIDFETSDASNAGVSARIDAEYVTGSGLTELVFYANRASSLDEIMRLTYTGNIKVPDGSGIDFSATSGTGTSELFDDYEEGDFTVQFADAVSGGNSVNGGYGHYTKVGNLVTVSFAIVNMNTSGLTGGNTLYFRGLPYTARTVSGPGIFVGSTNVSNVTSTGQPTACLAESGTWGYFRDTAGNILVSDVSSGTGDIYVSLTYEAV